MGGVWGKVIGKGCKAGYRWNGFNDYPLVSRIEEELLKVVVMERVNGLNKNILKVTIGVIFLTIAWVINGFLEVELK